jgi:hypothetical protein
MNKVALENQTIKNFYEENSFFQLALASQPLLASAKAREHVTPPSHGSIN